jgi:hypothetical protein
MKYISIINLSLFLLLISTATNAANLGFLNNSPASMYNKDDITLMDQTINKALNELSDKEKLDWNNPKTTASGSVFVSNTHKTKVEQAVLTCRDVNLVNQAKNQKRNTKLTFCKDNENNWKAFNKPRL